MNNMRTIDLDLAIKTLQAITPINDVGKVTIDECIAQLKYLYKPEIKTWDEKIKDGMFLLAEGCYEAMEENGCNNKKCPFADCCALLYEKYKIGPIELYVKEC